VLAAHRYWKRNGADIEVLGRKPHQAKVTLAYAGPTWRKDWLPLAASLDDDPTGPLVHPVYGQMPAVCEGFAEAVMNVETATNLYIVPLSFIEDQTDAQLEAQQTSPSELAQKASAHGAALLQQAPQQGPVRANVLAYVTTVVDYANAVVNTAQEALSYGRLLDAQFGRIEALAVAARDGIRGDPSTGNDAARYSTLALIEQTYDDCVQLNLAARMTVAPALIDYAVPSTMHIATLAVRFYGADGLSRIDEILVNNAGKIINPAAIEAGTLLSMAPATV
jgi:prophage DNA circulation protein